MYIYRPDATCKDRQATLMLTCQEAWWPGGPSNVRYICELSYIVARFADAGEPLGMARRSAASSTTFLTDLLFG
jgi:hypothetical protein